MAIEESEEVKRREKNKHNGGIKTWLDPGHVSRNVIEDSWSVSYPISDDLINRGYTLESAAPDETGFFLVCKFTKNDNYVP